MLPLSEEQRVSLATIPGIDSTIWSRVRQILTTPDLVAAALEEQRSVGEDPAATQELETLKQRVADIEQEQQRYIRRIGQTDDDAVSALMLAEVRQLDAQKTALSEMVTSLQERLAADRAQEAKIEDLLTYINRVTTNLDNADFDRKRLALEALGIIVWADGRERRAECRIPLAVLSDAANRGSHALGLSDKGVMSHESRYGFPS
jgi:hypothetical protein